MTDFIKEALGSPEVQSLIQIAGATLIAVVAAVFTKMMSSLLTGQKLTVQGLKADFSKELKAYMPIIIDAVLKTIQPTLDAMNKGLESEKIIAEITAIATVGSRKLDASQKATILRLTEHLKSLGATELALKIQHEIEKEPVEDELIVSEVEDGIHI